MYLDRNCINTSGPDSVTMTNPKERCLGRGISNKSKDVSVLFTSADGSVETPRGNLWTCSEKQKKYGYSSSTRRRIVEL